MDGYMLMQHIRSLAPEKAGIFPALAYIKINCAD
jgi:hypothetical protein